MWLKGFPLPELGQLPGVYWGSQSSVLTCFVLLTWLVLAVEEEGVLIRQRKWQKNIQIQTVIESSVIWGTSRPSLHYAPTHRLHCTIYTTLDNTWSAKKITCPAELAGWFFSSKGLPSAQEDWNPGDLPRKACQKLPEWARRRGRGWCRRCLAGAALQTGEPLPKGSCIVMGKGGVCVWITTEMALRRWDALKEDCKSQVWKPT